MPAVLSSTFLFNLKIQCESRVLEATTWLGRQVQSLKDCCIDMLAQITQCFYTLFQKESGKNDNSSQVAAKKTSQLNNSNSILAPELARDILLNHMLPYWNIKDLSRFCSTSKTYFNSFLYLALVLAQKSYFNLWPQPQNPKMLQEKPKNSEEMKQVFQFVETENKMIEEGRELLNSCIPPKIDFSRYKTEAQILEMLQSENFVAVSGRTEEEIYKTRKVKQGESPKLNLVKRTDGSWNICTLSRDNYWNLEVVYRHKNGNRLDFNSSSNFNEDVTGHEGRPQCLLTHVQIKSDTISKRILTQTVYLTSSTLMESVIEKLQNSHPNNIIPIEAVAQTIWQSLQENIV